jgi:hypothetical protein
MVGENKDKLITLEQMVKIPTEQLMDMYRHGYHLDNLGIKSMVCIDGKEVTGVNILMGAVGIAVAALIYYKLGKWEAKHIGWE